MNSMELLLSMNNIEDQYILSAEAFRQGGKVGKLSKRKLWLIAAIVALVLLLAGCAVVYVLGLRDMQVAEVVVTQGADVEASGAYVPETEWVNTLVSLQGYNNRAAQLALTEWLEYRKKYNWKDALAQSGGQDETEVAEQYSNTYACYTAEMVQELQKILEKYNLKPLGSSLHIDKWESQLFYRALQMEGISKSNVIITNMVGYIFPEGSFCAKIDYTLEDTQYYANYTYAQNDYLYPYADTITRMDLWTQWPFTTSDGTALLLATFQNELMILCERSDGFITVHTKNWSTQDTITCQEAEKIADSFLYSIAPQPCDPAEVEQMRGDYQRPVEEKRFLTGFRISGSGGKEERWFPPEEYAGSLQEYIGYLLSNENSTDNKNVDQLEYCVTDFNNDGQPEVLLWYADTGTYRELLEMADFGGPEPEVSVRFIHGNVYEGPVFERLYDRSKSDGFVYHRFTDFQWNDLAYLRYDPAAKAWAKTDSPQFLDPEVHWTPISTSEAKAIRSQYTPLAMDMKPLSWFSMADQ